MDFQAQIHHLFSLNGAMTILTLTLLEIVLGIDNIIFISIAAGKLQRKDQGKARAIGLTMALVIRSVLLFFAAYLATLKQVLFYISDFGVSGSDLVFMAGGLFLLVKTIMELKAQIYGEDNHEKKASDTGSVVAAGFASIILQIMVIDIVFSFDSILAAVSLTQEPLIMIIAVTISMLIMLSFSGPVSDFINRYENVKTLALLFLLVIALVLIADGLHLHFSKNYIYVALFFSLAVEGVNIWRKRIAIRKGRE